MSPSASASSRYSGRKDNQSVTIRQVSSNGGPLGFVHTSNETTDPTSTKRSQVESSRTTLSATLS